MYKFMFEFVYTLWIIACKCGPLQGRISLDPVGSLWAPTEGYV
jgi:hypothetical protein